MHPEDTNPLAACDGGLITLLEVRACGGTADVEKSEDDPLELFGPVPDAYTSGDFGFGIEGPRSSLLNCCCWRS